MYYYDTLEPTQCSGEGFDTILSLGWYPIEQTIFTTSHLFMDEDSLPMKVHWLRYPVNSVLERTSHRRIRRKNSVFEIELADPFVHRTELDSLYKKYLDSVDFDGYPTIQSATFARGERNIFNTNAVVIRQGERIISCGIFHVGNNSVASILHFYDPDYKQFSPGKFLILKTIDFCKKKGIQWYYPGYVIQGDPKMNYKLFLGQETSQYYHYEDDPLLGSWNSFRPELLTLKREHTIREETR